MLEVKDLVKVYNAKGGVKVKALDGVSVTFPETGMVFLLGKSGSGKSTLLNVAGGLDKPDSGEVIVKGRSSKNFSSADFDSYRNTYVGFIFQEYNILNEFTVEQNIALALQLQNKKNDKTAVDNLLKEVDLEGLGNRKPNTLSGGQKQRVAIARALIKNPEIIMADEPTGALDSNTGKQVFDTLKKLSATRLVVIVSHDRDFAEIYADRIIELKDGKIISDVSKTETQAQKDGENIKILGDGTVAVKDTQAITEKDVKRILESLKSYKGEAIITANQGEIAEVKRVCGITENETKKSFEQTGSVAAVAYDGTKTKFIKSRLPVKHAFRIGASGMKAKPLRLVFTILLCTISFMMFGLFSTLTFYDSSQTLYNTIKELNPSVITAKKAYLNKVTKIESDGSSYDYENELYTKMTDDELKDMQSKFGSESFGAVATDDSITLADLTSEQTAKIGNYYTKNIKYVAYLQESATLRNKIIAGTYPINDNEVCITSYTARVLVKLDGKEDTDEEIKKLVGREVLISGETYKVTAILDCGDATALSDFASHKSEQSMTLTKEENNKFTNIIQDGYYLSVFYNEARFNTLLKELSAISNPLSDYTDTDLYVCYERIDSASAYEDVNYQYMHYTQVSNIPNTNGYKTYYATGKTNVENGEIVISYDALKELLNYSFYDYGKLTSELFSSDAEKAYLVAYWLDGENIPTGEGEENYRTYQKFLSLVGDSGEYNYFYKMYRAIKKAKETEFTISGEIKTVQSWLDSVEISGYGAMTDSKSDEILSTILPTVMDCLNEGGLKIKAYVYSRGDSSFTLSNAKSVKIVGVCTYKYYDMAFLTADDYSLMLQDSIDRGAKTKEIVNKTKFKQSGNEKYDVIFLNYSQDLQSQLKNVFSNKYAEDDTKYTISIGATSSVYLVDDIVSTLAKGFMWAGIIFGVFALLLFSVFIATSISYKKKDIGILRAVGARGSDVFKIFFAESFIIDMICIVLSIVGSVLICGAINKSMSAEYNIAPFVFGWKSILVIIAIAAVAAIVATFLPVRKAAKKPPVESIRAL